MNRYDEYPPTINAVLNCLADSKLLFAAQGETVMLRVTNPNTRRYEWLRGAEALRRLREVAILEGDWAGTPTVQQVDDLVQAVIACLPDPETAEAAEMARIWRKLERGLERPLPDAV